MTGLHHVRVLVPMLGRAHLVGPMVEHLRVISDAPVLFICSPDDRDAIVACNQTNEDVLVVDWQPGRADYARKINLGFRETLEPWVFTGASDLMFHEGWDAHAVHIGEMNNAGVVGTQDGANPSVKRGIQSTHSLIRRQYIDEQGGTYDNTGAIYSEAYDHNYTDVELVETAKLRGQWAFSKRSVVEHRHPHWGTAENDATYEKAMREAGQDRRLHHQRMRRANTEWARRRKRAAL